MRKHIAIIAACCITLLAGCVTTPTGERQLTESGKVALQEVAGIAMRRFLRDHPKYMEDASKIREVALQLQSVTDVATVTDLRALAEAEIIKRVSDPLDREDLLALVRLSEAVIKEQIGNDRLDSTTRVRVNEYIGMLIAALPRTQ